MINAYNLWCQLKRHNYDQETLNDLFFVVISNNEYLGIGCDLTFRDVRFPTDCIMGVFTGTPDGLKELEDVLVDIADSRSGCFEHLVQGNLGTFFFSIDKKGIHHGRWNTDIAPLPICEDDEDDEAAC